MTQTQAAIRLVVLSGIFPLCLFPFAGRWDWPVAWAVVGLLMVATVLSRLLAFRVHPDLLDERAGSLDAENAKPWDRRLAPAMALTPLLVLVVAGLDERFGWSPAFSPALQAIGLVMVALGYVFATWAMIVNGFFSGIVRIQTERGHRVVDGGPYALVRHPGYSGSLLATAGFTLALSSLWALLPLLLVVAVTVIRTRLEDETLTEELPGYAAFRERTRFRLLPGVW
jgi:protein-S-isoprenylcysteine O-methyltransferase Ste14